MKLGQREEADCWREAERQAGFIYVNNRLEGNALETIAAMTEPSIW